MTGVRQSVFTRVGNAGGRLGGFNPPVNFSTLSVQLSSKVLGGSV